MIINNIWHNNLNKDDEMVCGRERETKEERKRTYNDGVEEEEGEEEEEEEEEESFPPFHLPHPLLHCIS